MSAPMICPTWFAWTFEQQLVPSAVYRTMSSFLEWVRTDRNRAEFYKPQMLQLHDQPHKHEDMREYRRSCIGLLAVPRLCSFKSVVVGIAKCIGFEEHRPKRRQNKRYRYNRQANHSLNSIEVANIILSTFSFDDLYVVAGNTIIQHHHHISWSEPIRSSL